MVDVAAALIWDGDRFMICRRPPHKARGLMWEFPGGKREAGETLPQCLVRECREELDIELEVGDKYMELVHEYPDLTVRLSLFNSRIASGVPKMLEHCGIEWIRAGDADRYEFCPADKDILIKLKQDASHDR